MSAGNTTDASPRLLARGSRRHLPGDLTLQFRSTPRHAGLLSATTTTNSVRITLGAWAALWLAACGARAQTFTDVTVAAGVDYLQWRGGEPQSPLPSQRMMSGGAAVGDFDNDGWTDLFVTRVDDTDLLFRNRGDGTFEDVSAAAGFTHILPTNGAAWGDLDNDHDLDLYVTSAFGTENYLYINDGSGRFSEQAFLRHAQAITNIETGRYGVTLGDYDRDGYLDIHTTDWGAQLDIPGGLAPDAARLFRNLGARAPGFFTNVTFSAGVMLQPGAGYAPLGQVDGVRAFASRFTDLDDDGWPDLAIAGDFHTSQLFWNNRDGTFSEGTSAAGVGTDENGMGSTVGDFNGDGRLDWFVTSIYDPSEPCAAGNCNWSASGNRLYENLGNRLFRDATDEAGVRDGGWGWGTTFLDYDNDGDLDLVMTNGFRERRTVREDAFNQDVVRLWRNDGDADPKFTEVAVLEGVDDDGSGKGLLTFDYDQDGDLDLFIVNNAGGPRLYRNDTTSDNDWLRVATVGTRSNRDGIGARITVIADLTRPDVLQVREIDGGSNFLGQNERVAHFGLGAGARNIDLVSIRWPSGKVQEFTNLAPGQLLTAIEPVPEPSTGIMLNVVAGCLACGRRPSSKQRPFACDFPQARLKFRRRAPLQRSRHIAG